MVNLSSWFAAVRFARMLDKYKQKNKIDLDGLEGAPRYLKPVRPCLSFQIEKGHLLAVVNMAFLTNQSKINVYIYSTQTWWIHIQHLIHDMLESFTQTYTYRRYIDHRFKFIHCIRPLMSKTSLHVDFNYKVDCRIVSIINLGSLVPWISSAHLIVTTALIVIANHCCYVGICKVPLSKVVMVLLSKEKNVLVMYK